MRLLRPRWGVRGSLFAAFAVIAGMAIVISAGAGMVLRHLGVTMVDLSGQDIPRLAASLQLSAQSASLASQGPSLLSSPNEDTLRERTRKMKEIQDVAQQKLAEIIELGADKAVVAALGETIKNINEATQSLVSASRERLEAGGEHDKQYRCAAQRAGGFHRRREPGDAGCADAASTPSWRPRSLPPDDATEAARAVESSAT